MDELAAGSQKRLELLKADGVREAYLSRQPGVGVGWKASTVERWKLALSPSFYRQETIRSDLRPVGPITDLNGRVGGGLFFITTSRIGGTMSIVTIPSPHPP